MLIELFKVHNDIKFREEIFEGLGKYVSDDWNWFNVYEKNGTRIVENFNIQDDSINIDFNNYNVDRELSEKLSFESFSVGLYFTPDDNEVEEYEEYVSHIRSKYSPDIIQVTRILTKEEVVKDSDLIKEEREQIYVTSELSIDLKTTKNLMNSYPMKIAVTADHYKDIKSKFIDQSDYDKLKKLENAMKNIKNFVVVLSY